MVCFFFKQKTAYEMRISDWSSDVCSSDLRDVELDLLVAVVGLRLAQVPRHAGAAQHGAGAAPVVGLLRAHPADVDGALEEDAIVGEQDLDGVDDPRAVLAELGDVHDEPDRQVLGDGAGAGGGGREYR